MLFQERPWLEGGAREGALCRPLGEGEQAFGAPAAWKSVF